MATGQQKPLQQSATRVAQVLITFAVTFGVLWLAMRQPAAGKPTVPPLALWTHLTTALICVPLGAWVLYAKKGTAQHKTLGRLWVALMLVTATASLFLQHRGSFSFIHIFSVWTYVSTFMAVRAIRRGNVRAHMGYMKGLYTGLIVAGILAAALPGRFLSQALLSFIA